MRIPAKGPLLVLAACHAGSCTQDCPDRRAAHGGALLQTRASPGRAEAEVSLFAPVGLNQQHPAAPAPAASGEASGEEPDPHYTLHGCQCHHFWKTEVDGKLQTFEGCADVASDHAEKWAWCKVMDDCEKPAGKEADGAMWDYCSMDKEVSHLRTVHGCHCNPHFEWNNTIWDSCSKTSQGPKWCYVFESDQLCPESLRTEHHGQHWDYCYTLNDAAPYLTMNGCHCMPKYYMEEDGKEVEYEGCTEMEFEGEKIQGCIILEDGEGCHAKYEVEGKSHQVDICSVNSGDVNGSLAALDTAFDENCHCQPEWEWKGKTYKGCSQTPGKESTWCFIVEDARKCPEQDGVAQSGLSTQRWRWCGTSPDAKPPSQTPEEGDFVTVLPGDFDHGCDHYENRTGKVIKVVTGSPGGDSWFSIEGFVRDDKALCRFNDGDVKVKLKKSNIPQVGDLVEVLPGRLDNGCSIWLGRSGVVEKFVPNDGDPYYLIKGFIRDDGFNCRFRNEVLKVLPPKKEEAELAPKEVIKIVPIIVPVQDNPRVVGDGEMSETAPAEAPAEAAAEAPAEGGHGHR